MQVGQLQPSACIFLGSQGLGSSVPGHRAPGKATSADKDGQQLLPEQVPAGGEIAHASLLSPVSDQACLGPRQKPVPRPASAQGWCKGLQNTRGSESWPVVLGLSDTPLPQQLPPVLFHCSPTPWQLPEPPKIQCSSQDLPQADPGQAGKRALGSSTAG